MAKTIERLGDTEAAPGYLLLQLLSQQGWRISILRGFGGGVIVTATKPGLPAVEKHGATVSEIAAAVVEEASTVQLLSDPGPLH